MCLLVVATLAIWMLTQTLTPAAIKDIINKKLATMVGQKSQVDGEVVWHLFPRPGIKITQLHLGEKDNNGNYVLYVENLLINLQITPLFNGNFIFNELKMDGLSVNINPVVEKNIKINRPSDTLLTQNNPSKKVAPQFAIDHFLLKNGRVLITQPQNKITLSGLQVEAKQLNLKNNSFPLQLKANIVAAIAGNKIKTTLNYQGNVGLDALIFNQPLIGSQDYAQLDGQLLLKNLSFNQFKVAKIATNVKTKPGEINFNPFNISLYAGKSVGNLNYKLTSKQLTINQTATSLDANQLFIDIFAKTVMKGNLDFSIHATTNLNDSNWQNSLRGNGNLAIKDGVLYFIDLNQFVNQAVSKIHSLLSQATDNLKLVLQRPFFTTSKPIQGSTTFKLFTVQYRLVDGKIQSDSLLLQTDKLQLSGNGEVDFNTGAQALNLSAKIITDDSAVNQIQQLVGGSFPVKVYGTITDPKISPNNQYLNPIVSTFLLKNTLEQPVKQIGDQFKNLLTTPKNLLQDTLR
jgi:uncharacterized protein involved in outer membrane biogenesis